MGDLYFIESKGRNSLIYKDGFQSIQCGIMILNDTKEFKKKKDYRKKEVTIQCWSQRPMMVS